MSIEAVGVIVNQTNADTEYKRKAIVASTPQDNPFYTKLNSARHTVSDDEMLKHLIGLK